MRVTKFLQPKKRKRKLDLGPGKAKNSLPHCYKLSQLKLLYGSTAEAWTIGNLTICT